MEQVQMEQQILVVVEVEEVELMQVEVVVQELLY
jgi:hypothetical protein